MEKICFQHIIFEKKKLLEHTSAHISVRICFRSRFIPSLKEGNFLFVYTHHQPHNVPKKNENMSSRRYSRCSQILFIYRQFVDGKTLYARFPSAFSF